MIPKECKRLAEADFPIAAVSSHAGREKASPPGHPSRLHLWWARRPLAACRSMLLALLLPDPTDEKCPRDFKDRALEHLPRAIGSVQGSDEGLREAMMRFIGDFASWEFSASGVYLDVARSLVKAAYSEAPLVVDPFSGGGSIPLEALRIGCEAFASDVNPVAGLILKAMLEDVSRSEPTLVDDLRKVGAAIQSRTKKELDAFFPQDSDGATPVAYLWSRTVRCESPQCGAEVPIFRSPWLSKKGAARARYFQEHDGGSCVVLLIDRAPLGGPITFRIARGHGSENARAGFKKLSGTKATGNNANVVCPCCGNVLPGNKKNPRTPIQLAEQRGGADVRFDEQGNRVGGAFLLAVVTRSSGRSGQDYRLPTPDDYDVVWKAQRFLSNELSSPLKGGVSEIPDEPLPPPGTLGFRVQRYGVLKWGDLFTARQKVALAVLRRHVSDAAEKNPELASLLALAFNRVAMSNMSCTRWNAVGEKMQHTFGRQALPIVWDFAEIVPTANAPGNWESGYELVSGVVARLATLDRVGQVQLADACESPLVPESADVWFTDPPYYDAVPYADLSDFFFVWLKRVLPNHPLLRDPFDRENPLTPKTQEIVQDETRTFADRPKGRDFFEDQMGRAFAEGRKVLKEDGIGCVVFAHKTTQGWEALLSGMIRGGLTITGSWPIATEMGTRLRARESAALATSVHLVCRPRPENAGVGDWGEIVRELPHRVRGWMERLQTEGIRGADLVFACIGPALEIFSRYSNVETAEGVEVRLADYLEKVWEVVGRIALEEVLGTAGTLTNGAAGALEEDARLTALFLWTIQATNGHAEESDEDDGDDDDEVQPQAASKGYSLAFDVVRRFAQPLGIHLPDWEARIIQTKKGVVRLFSVSERAEQLLGGDNHQFFVAQGTEANAPAQAQLTLFPDQGPDDAGDSHVPSSKGGTKVELRNRKQLTVLDRLHAGMLLQATGHAAALRRLLDSEQRRGPEFVRLANALTALYPQGSEEKRLLDAMLLGMPK